MFERLVPGDSDHVFPDVRAVHVDPGVVERFFVQISGVWVLVRSATFNGPLVTVSKGSVRSTTKARLAMCRSVSGPSKAHVTQPGRRVTLMLGQGDAGPEGRSSGQALGPQDGSAAE